EGMLETSTGRRLRASRTFSDSSIREPAGHFVRPEKISLLRERNDPAEVENVVPGTVSRISFLGNVVRYNVDIGDGASLTVDLQNSAGQELFRRGEAVVAAWNAADSLMFRHGWRCRDLPGPESRNKTAKGRRSRLPAAAFAG